MTVKFRDFLNEQLKDDEFRTEYEALEAEEAMMCAINYSGLTLAQISEKTGISQSEIRKLESGTANPTLQTIKNLAQGLGLKLHIEFQPA